MHRIRCNRLAVALLVVLAPFANLGLSGFSLNSWLDDATGMSIETYQRGPDYQRWVGPDSNGRGHGVYFAPRQQTLGTSQNVPLAGRDYDHWVGGDGSGNGVYFTPRRVVNAGDFTRQQYQYTLALGKGMTEDGRFINPPTAEEFFGVSVADADYEYNTAWTADKDMTLRYRVVNGRIVRHDFHFNKP